MKKMLRVLVIALLCLMMALPASAGASLYRDGLDYGTMSFITNTDLLKKGGNDGYALMNVDGDLLTDTIYNSYMEVWGNYIITAQNTLSGYNVYGVLNTKGETVVPFEYNIIKIRGDWAVAIALEDANSNSYDYSNTAGDSFYNINNVGLYYLPETKHVATLTRDQYLDHSEVNGYINIQSRTDSSITTYDKDFNALGTVDSLYDDEFAPAKYTVYRENGQYGIKDREGNIIMPPSFANVYVSNYNYFTVSTGSAEGLADVNGNVVVPAEYDSVKRMNGLPYNDEVSGYGYKALDTYYCVEKDGKVGFVTDGNVVTSAPKYSESVVENNGASLQLTDLEGNVIIVAADGVETTLSGYDTVRHISQTSGVYYRVTNADGAYGLIDWHGEIILPCEYEHIGSMASGSGDYLTVSKDFENFEIYKLDYPTPASQSAASAEIPAETPAETTETPAETTGGANAGGLLGHVKPASRPQGEQSAPETDAPAADAPAADAPAASGDNATVLGLLNSAVTLLNTDAAANGASVVSLLNTAATLLSSNPDAATLLTSAATLLSNDAGANGPAALSLINSAIAMLQ